MKKAFFIVPGFQEQTTQKQYKWLINFLPQKGYKVFGVPMKWKYRVMSDYASQFREFYGNHKLEENYILGFSYGAVVTFLTANDLNPKKIFLCSLSPDFKEDSLGMKKWIKNFLGKNRLKDIQTRSGKNVARNLKISSTVFYGEKEGKQYPRLKIRCEETVKLAKKSKLVIVKNARHKIDDLEYVIAIKNEI